MQCGNDIDFVLLQLYTNTSAFFLPGQFLLADSGYSASYTVIPAFKRVRGQNLTPDKQAFNTHLSQQRVEVEHCIGMLKNRWHSMKNLWVKLKDHRTAQRLVVWLRVCVILHNMMLEQKDTFVPSNADAMGNTFEPVDQRNEDDDTYGENTEHQDYLFNLFIQNHRTPGTQFSSD